jgi:hypothetical protein
VKSTNRFMSLIWKTSSYLWWLLFWFDTKPEIVYDNFFNFSCIQILF